MADWNATIIAEFRARGGRVGGVFEGADLVLLTTTGARSGLRRTSPLGVAREDGRLLVFGSNAGADRHPDWYRNLLVHPRAEVETADGRGGVRTLAVRAEVLEGAARDAAYARQAARVPAYGDYQRRTARVIPVVALHPLDLTVPDAARNRAIAAQLLTVHAELRAQLARLREGGAAAGGPAVHCLAFCEALGAHHASEDAVLPAFDEAFPHLAPVLARLRAEHREVARELAGLRSAAGEPGADLAARLDALAGRMEEHFTYEEEHLIPVLTGQGAGPED
ncbi:nitroreductase/quinone reductase family protein [Streptomyces sp. NPDC020983]|uniref:nitroreductase/quinone reductase family protein n=1 Tax=Streptomyces sp. NPDC020983 TaxID=3365106 RepID=UPI00379AAF0B